MKEFTTCFIGIPLPDEYQSEFELLLKDLSTIDPNLEITDPTIPHITGYYLDEQSQMYLPEIAEAVKTKVHLLKGAEITVGGMGTFGGDTPTVLFLNIKHSDSLQEFNNELTKVLYKFYAVDNNLSFHAHMTVARMYLEAAQQSFAKTQLKIKSRMEDVSWVYPITEVVLYGVDSRKQPEHQEKLICITL